MTSPESGVLTPIKAVSCGELVDTTISADKKMKTFKYNLTVPTSAPNIGLAIGPFDIHVDRAMPEMTHFCLHGLQKELKTTTAMTYQARDQPTEISSSVAEKVLTGRFGRSLDPCIKQSFIMKNYFQPVFHFRFINKFLFRNFQKNINPTGKIIFRPKIPN